MLLPVTKIFTDRHMRAHTHTHTHTHHTTHHTLHTRTCTHIRMYACTYEHTCPHINGHSLSYVFMHPQLYVCTRARICQCMHHCAWHARRGVTCVTICIYSKILWLILYLFFHVHLQKWFAIVPCGNHIAIFIRMRSIIWDIDLSIIGHMHVLL